MATQPGLYLKLLDSPKVGFLATRLMFLCSFPVPQEAVAFLGAVGAFLTLLVVFFLYLNKLLCFSSCGGFPCVDQKPKKKERKTSKLGKDYKIWIYSKQM